MRSLLPVRTVVEWNLLSFIVLLLILSHCSGELTQEEDFTSGRYDNYLMKQDDGFSCLRECRPNEPRVCYYKWIVEQYTILNSACGHCPDVFSDCFLPQCVTADGFEKQIMTVNRMLPGPSIQVCEGDTVVVDVVNKMPGRSTAIHWHGMHQKHTPWMDGVPYVTQCPILEGTTFRYQFLAAQPGTSFWHSHDGLQKVDGLAGSLIVRKPDSESVQRKFYDFDLPSHVVVIQDWFHSTADARFPGYFRNQTNPIGQDPETFLINGRGVKVVNKTVLVGETPLAEFSVRQGYRYRFRLIGSSCLSCMFRFSVQNHKLLAIAVDRNPIEPVYFDSISMSAGERYDVVIEAFHPVASYWIMVEGLGVCRSLSQVAVMKYHGYSSRPPTPLAYAFPDNDNGYTLNPLNAPCNDDSMSYGKCISQLQNRIRNPSQVLKPEADFKIKLPFGFHVFNNEELHYSGTFPEYIVAPTSCSLAGIMMNKSHINPPSPLLTQLYDISPDIFCENTPCLDPRRLCTCCNVIRVPLNAVVEFMLIHTDAPDKYMLSHPFHIHGHYFYVVEQGLLPEGYFTSKTQIFLQQKMNEKRYFLGPYLPNKDTIPVATCGYTILRIITDNPGFWFFHCHFAYHQEVGMAFVLWVGDIEDVPPPPLGFPRCGNFLRPIEPICESSYSHRLLLGRP